VCAFDAIHIVDGVAFVDKEKCTACGMCVAECPINIIELVPQKARTYVACSSNDKGKDVKTVCSIGCIGCKLCEKACEYDAIHVNDNLAKIDYGKCTNCGACVKVCPVKVIQQTA
ncbi:MAG TPA: 4Fe-4S binding protein, partial [Mobilitalea sp.]|nr:4Fe-4S binding protein [Mobilitalea sp.]